MFRHGINVHLNQGMRRSGSNIRFQSDKIRPSAYTIVPVFPGPKAPIVTRDAARFRKV